MLALAVAAAAACWCEVRLPAASAPRPDEPMSGVIGRGEG